MNISRLLESAWPDWRVMREIGTGSEGAVYMISRRSPATHDFEFSALKVIPLSEADGPSGRRHDGRREEAMLRQVADCPYITRLQDSMTVCDRDAGEDFLLLKLELLLPLEEYEGFDIVGLGADVCGALSALHRQHIYHLDVKPDNVFIGPDRRFRLGDLSTARQADELPSVRCPAGTRHYAAPELREAGFRLDAEAAVRADLYALGMMLLELYIWKQYQRCCHGPADVPRDREEWFDIQRGYEARETWRLERPDHDIEDVICRALAADPAKRYASADAMRHALLALEDPARPPREAGDVEASLSRFIDTRPRSVLTLLYPSGVRRYIAERPALAGPVDEEGFTRVGWLWGIELSCIGGDLPETIFVNDTPAPVTLRDGRITLALSRLFRDREIPERLDIEAVYAVNPAHTEHHRWRLNQRPPHRHWEWFKRPDWT